MIIVGSTQLLRLGGKRAACFLFGGGIIKKRIERRYWQHGGVVAIETRDMLLQVGALQLRRTIGLQQGTVQSLQGEQETSADPEPRLSPSNNRKAESGR